MLPPADNPAPLSVTRAFVVQFRAHTAVEQGPHYVSSVETFARPFYPYQCVTTF